MLEEQRNTSTKMDERFQHGNTDEDMMAKGAIIQRDGTYAIAPHIAGGVITDFNMLRKMADVAEKYGCAAMKVTSSQRIAFVGLQKEDVDSVWNELAMEPGAAVGLCVRSVKFCPGTTFCRLGQQDSMGLGSRLDKKFHGMNLPSKFKIGISGCSNMCMDSMQIDFGAVGTPKGYKIYVGGNGGRKPRLGDLLAEEQTPEQVEETLDKIIDYYKASAKTNERLGRFIDRIGLENFKEEVLSHQVH